MSNVDNSINVPSSWLVGTFMPILGCVLGWLLFITMLPRIRTIYHEKALKGFSPIPLCWVFPNTLFGISYAILLQDHYIYACNSVIVILSFWSVVQLLAARDMPPLVRRNATAILIGNIALWLSANFICLVLLSNGPPSPHQRGPLILSTDPIDAFKAAQVILGTCNGLTIMGFYVYPLLQLYDVFRNRDASPFVFPTVVLTCVNCCIWTVYGIYLKDPFVYTPSLIGGTVASIQSVACFAFRHNTRPIALTDDSDSLLRNTSRLPSASSSSSSLRVEAKGNLPLFRSGTPTRRESPITSVASYSDEHDTIRDSSKLPFKS